MEFKHTSVLLDETIENLNIRPDGVYMDGTLGGAGHSKEIAKRLGPDGHLIGIDQDGEAIITAKERLAEYGDRITVVRDNYQNFKKHTRRAKYTSSGRDIAGSWRIFISTRQCG